MINNMRKACKSGQTDLRHAVDQLRRSNNAAQQLVAAVVVRRPVIGCASARLGFATFQLDAACRAIK